MLGNIRKNVANPVIQGLLGLVIFVFIFFFGWSMRSKTDTAVIAKVNGEPITPTEYRDAYNNLLEVYGRLTGQRPDTETAKKMGIPKRAFDQLVDQKLLMQEVHKKDIKVADEELAQAIQRQEAFRDGTSFNKEKYKQILGSVGLSPEHYEAIKRQELATIKLKDSLRTGLSVSDTEIVEEFKARKSQAAVDYVEFDPETFAQRLKPAADKLAEFYKAESETFKKDEMRSARYTIFPVESYMAQIDVSEEKAKEEFRLRSFNFVQKPTAHARHILVLAPSEADDAALAKAEARIKSIAEKIKSGQSFEAAAKTYSEDEATRGNGGDLGTFVQGTMIPAFDSAVFSMKPGEVSGPVRTQFGFHLIKLESRSEERQRSFEESKKELIDLLKREKARDLAYRAADNALMDLEKKDTDWNAIAKRHPVKTTPLFQAKERNPETPQLKGFSEALFELPESKVGVLLETPAGTFLISVAEKRPSQVPPLESIRSEVEAKFRIVEGKKLAREAAAAFASDAAQKGWTSAQSLLLDKKIKTSETFTKKSGTIPPLGASPEAVKAIFEKPETGRVIPTAHGIAGKFYAFRISAISAADMGSLELERDKIRNDLLPAKHEEAFETLLKGLRDSAKITDVSEGIFN